MLLLNGHIHWGILHQSNFMKIKRIYHFSQWLSILQFTFLCIVLISCTSPKNSSDKPFRTGVLAPNLLLDESVFPARWLAQACEPQCDRDERSGHALRNFYIEGSSTDSDQEVSYIGKEEDASAAFQRRAGPKGRNVLHIPNIEYLPPPQIAYRSPIADEQSLVCGVSDNIPECYSVLRYGNYLIEWRFELAKWLWIESEEGLQLEEVEAILREMDLLVATEFDLPTSALEVTVSPNNNSIPFPLALTPPHTIPDLIEALSHDDLRMRVDATYALIPYESQAKDATPKIIDNLKYLGNLKYEEVVLVSEIDLRYASIRAIMAIDSGTREAIPPLLEIIQYNPFLRGHLKIWEHGTLMSDYGHLRSEAADALAKIGDSYLIPELIEILYVEDEEGIALNGIALAVGELAGEDFSWLENEQYYINGVPQTASKAIDWWEREGQYQDW